MAVWVSSWRGGWCIGKVLWWSEEIVDADLVVGSGRDVE